MVLLEVQAAAQVAQLVQMLLWLRVHRVKVMLAGITLIQEVMALVVVAALVR
jgi:hypothetical protein